MSLSLCTVSYFTGLSVCRLQLLSKSGVPSVLNYQGLEEVSESRVGVLCAFNPVCHL